jgi:hypothetical protein
MGIAICNLPPVLQAKLNLLHDRVEEWLHVTADSLCDVSNGNKCFKKKVRAEMVEWWGRAYRTSAH